MSVYMGPAPSGAPTLWVVHRAIGHAVDERHAPILPEWSRTLCGLLGEFGAKSTQRPGRVCSKCRAKVKAREESR